MVNFGEDERIDDRPSLMPHKTISTEMGVNPFDDNVARNLNQIEVRAENFDKSKEKGVKNNCMTSIRKSNRKTNLVERFSTDLSKKAIKAEHTRQKSERKIKIQARSYVAVRNESDGFYLCKLCQNLYKDSKKCKIQWLEEILDANGVGKNKYQLSYVDWLHPLAIIKRVEVVRAEPEVGLKKKRNLVSIEPRYLDRVKHLLKEAIELTNEKDSNITLTQSTISSTASIKRNQPDLHNIYVDSELNETKSKRIKLNSPTLTTTAETNSSTISFIDSPVALPTTFSASSVAPPVASVATTTRCALM